MVLGVPTPATSGGVGGSWWGYLLHLECVHRYNFCHS